MDVDVGVDWIDLFVVCDDVDFCVYVWVVGSCFDFE